jgi:hypothetical protein
VVSGGVSSGSDKGTYDMGGGGAGRGFAGGGKYLQLRPWWAALTQNHQEEAAGQQNREWYMQVRVSC